MNLKQKIETLRDMKAELAPQLDQLKALENEVKKEILESGEAPQVDGVIVTFRNGYIRESWDSRALAGSVSLKFS